MVFCCPVAGSIGDGDQWDDKDNERCEDVLAMLNFILELSEMERRSAHRWEKQGLVLYSSYKPYSHA
jgi:hypothetical protein